MGEQLGSGPGMASKGISKGSKTLQGDQHCDLKSNQEQSKRTYCVSIFIALESLSSVASLHQITNFLRSLSLG